MEHLDTLYELCDIVSKELAEATDKIHKGGGKLSGSDAEYVDKLTHTLKSIKTVIAMEEADDGYSHDYRPYPYMRGGSYARGRGSRAKRDSMGRYSSMYYDAADDVREKLKDMMDETTDEKMKVEIQKFMGKLDQM